LTFVTTTFTSTSSSFLFLGRGIAVVLDHSTRFNRYSFTPSTPPATLGRYCTQYHKQSRSKTLELNAFPCPVAQRSLYLKAKLIDHYTTPDGSPLRLRAPSSALP
jgi:hypothetical protein